MNRFFAWSAFALALGVVVASFGFLWPFVTPAHLSRDFVRAHSQLPSCELHFAKGQLDVPVGARDNLQGLIERMNRTEEHLEIVGNASSPGDDLCNLGLGLARANVVRAMAISFGLSPDRIVIATKGESLPQFPQDTPAGQLMDQVVRVQVVGDNERNARGFKMRR